MQIRRFWLRIKFIAWQQLFEPNPDRIKEQKAFPVILTDIRNENKPDQQTRNTAR